MGRATVIGVLALAGCEPTLLVIERPPLPPGTVAVALIALDPDTGAATATLRRADDAAAVRFDAPLDAEVHVYAYDRALGERALPDGGSALEVTAGCAAHALPPAAWRWSIRGSRTSTSPRELSLAAPALDCAAADPGWVAAPSDEALTTCRSLALVRDACALRIVENASACPASAPQPRPAWGLRVDGTPCPTPLTGTCDDDAVLPPLQRGAVCGADDVPARFGLLIPAPLIASVTTVTIAAALSFAGEDGAHQAELGDAMTTGTVVDFVAAGDDWVVFGSPDAASPSTCASDQPTPLYRVDRRTLAVTALPADQRGCLRAPLALPDGGFLAGFRRTRSATAAALLGVARFDASGRAIGEVMLPPVDALAARGSETDDSDERLIAALVDVTTAGGRPTALAVVRGYCVSAQHFCTYLHLLDAETLDTVAVDPMPAAQYPLTAHRDDAEVVIAYDAPDRLEVRPLPLDLAGPALRLDPMPRSGAGTGSLAARRHRLWMLGLVADVSHVGGLRIHTERPPSMVSTLHLLGAHAFANPFAIAALEGEALRVLAFFTRPGRDDRRTWVAEVPLGTERTTVLGTSRPLGRGVVGRVRAEGDDRLWALVPERGVMLRMDLPPPRP